MMFFLENDRGSRVNRCVLIINKSIIVLQIYCTYKRAVQDGKKVFILFLFFYFLSPKFLLSGPESSQTRDERMISGSALLCSSCRVTLSSADRPATASDSVVDPHHFCNLDPHPDPHQHQLKIKIRILSRIRIKVIGWIRNRIRIHINLQMTSQNVWNMSLYEHFFKGLSLYLEARIWIRIRIRVKSRIWI
jgi:hypothetical protein